MSSEITPLDKVFISRKIILEMLEYRGYDASIYEQFTKEEIKVLMNNSKLNMFVEHKTQDRTLLIHYFALTDNATSIKTQQIKSVLETLNVESNKSVIKDNTDTVILVFPTAITDTLKKLGTEFYDTTGIYIQMYDIKDLMFNILKHDLVPLHIIITDEEYTRDVKIPYKITKPNLLPIIPRTDKVAMFIGMRPKEVCRIIRPSKTAGLFSNYFRYCK